MTRLFKDWWRIGRKIGQHDVRSIACHDFLRLCILTFTQLAEVASNQPSSLMTRSRQASGSEDDMIDPREIDKVISEVAAMASRWNLFRKYLSDSFRVR